MIKTFKFSGDGVNIPTPREMNTICFSRQDAFTFLYDAYIERVYRYVFLRVADDTMAEEITSQVFSEVWEKLPSYQTGKSPILSWLYSLAYNAIFNQCGANLQEESKIEVQYDKAQSFKSKSQQLPGAFGKLADKQQQKLLLEFMSEFDEPQISRQLENQQGTIRALQMDELNKSIAEYSTLKIEEIYAQ